MADTVVDTASVPEVRKVDGVFAAPSEIHDIDCLGYSSVNLQLGNTQGVDLGATIEVQGSVDGTHFVDIYEDSELDADGNINTIINATGLYMINCAGLSKLRLNSGSYAGASLPFSAVCVKTVSELFGVQAIQYTKVIP